MRIETDRLALRRWRPTDVDALIEIESDPLVGRWLGNPTPSEIERKIERDELSWDSHGFGRFAVEDRSTGMLVGKAGIMCEPRWLRTPDKDEIGWTVAATRWGQGIATEAAQAALHDARERVGLGTVVSWTQPGNHASRRVMEKLGLTYRDTTDWLGHRWDWYVAGL